MKDGTLSQQIEREASTGAPGRLKDQVEKTRTRLKNYTLDLRIHSPASLGYLGIEGLDTAPALVRLAKVKKLDVIAVTDFYSGKFVDRVVEAARNSPVSVIPGVVVRCVIGPCNDVTLLCLFPEGTNATRIEEFLKNLSVPEKAFGDRTYTLEVPVRQILEVLEVFGGIAVPSRMDKTPQRMQVVPTLVEEYGFRAFDLAYADTARFFKLRWPKTKFQLFSFSNANALAQVGSRTARVKMQAPGFHGLRQIVTRERPPEESK